MVYIRNFINELNITKLVFFGFFIRILFLIFFPQNFGDTQTYLRIGEEIFNGKTVYSDLHMPGYGIWAYILNVFFQSDHGFLIGDVIISSLTIYVIFLISKEIFLDNFISKTSAFLYTIYPYSIFYSVSGLSETLFVFLLFFSILMLYKDYFLVSSIILVFSIYVKSTSDLLAPIIIITFYFFVKKYNLKKISYLLFFYTIIYVILMAPWWYHNFKKYDSFIRLNLAANYHLYSGNNEKNKTGGGIGGIDVDHTVISKNFKNEPLALDKSYRDTALSYIKNNPYKTINLYFKKFKRFWNFYPFKIPDYLISPDLNYEKEFNADKYTSTKYKIISIFSYGTIFVLSLIFIIFFSKKYLKKISPFLIIIFVLTFIHIITISSIRYRFPIEPILIIFASYVIKRILNFKKISY